jgi:pimeloyl-ACP methyl ester carboxylesterase
MAPDRTHAARSADGTEIVGDVRGEGPPLVLIHGSLEDGRTCWRAMLPILERRFTCYLPSTRGRGRSGSAGDLRPRRRLEDVVAFVESVEPSAFLFGESDGGALALGAAAATDVAAVAAYEPPVFEVAGDLLQARLDATLPRVAEAVERDDLTAAAEAFSRMIATEDELASLSAADYLEEAGRYLPLFLRELEHDAASDAPGPTAASRMGRIPVPTLLLYGSESKLHDWFLRGVWHVARHVEASRVEEVPDAGHFGVVLRPEAIASRITRFFDRLPGAA